jgi:transcriptional regulator with XRE-family HTH domain
MSNNNIVKARARLKMTSGDAVRVMRDLQEMTQGELAATSGIPQPAISSIESGRSSLGADRAEKLARALHVHPAVLLWPNWEPENVVTIAKRTRASAHGRVAAK